MKHLMVPYLTGFGKHSKIQEIAESIKNSQRYHINIAPWESYHFMPEVEFSISHSYDSIFLQYTVHEKEIKAIYTKINDPVYKDSCVEFFVSPAGNEYYYNFEFNCLGTCLASFGKDRNERQMLPESVIGQIRSMTTFYKQDNLNQDYLWELTVALPVEVLCFSKRTILKAQSFRANFYKCGDDLSQPHYLVWNPIESNEPDFHLPEFFGEIEFL